MPPKRGRPSNAQKETSAAVSKGKGVTTSAGQEPANSPNGSITVSVGGSAAASPEMTKSANMKGGAATKKAKAQAEAAAKAKAEAEEVTEDATMEEADAPSTANAAETTANRESAATSTTTTKEGEPVAYGTIKKNSETALVVSNGSEVAGKSSNTVSASRGGNPYTAASRVIGTGYENINNLEEIQLRQLHEDIDAYQHDLAFCTATLSLPDLTPQETRTFQLRQLDLGHQIRHCQHRIETLQVQLRRQGIPFTNYSVGGGRAYTAALMSGAGQVAGQKRGKPSDEDDGSNEASGSAKKVKLTPDEPQLLDVDVDEPMGGASRDGETGSVPPNGHTSSPQRPEYGTPGTWEFNIPIIHRGAVHPDYQNGNNGHNGNGGGSSPYMVDEENAQNTALQRLGYWKCRLCSAPKYLLAGTGRSPAAPCKWPLKDISKMITHFTEMHTEHTPAERCSELGYALAKNRGPFEYWLRRTRAQNVGDGEIIDEIITELINGVMPHTLRRLSRAAAGMPV